MGEIERSQENSWMAAWPDALAFAVGLALAWFNDWQTRDLVWSLWLSSFVIGYAMIVWGIFGKGFFVATKAWGDREMLQGESSGPALASGTVMLVGGLFLLAFFTVHFGGFHFVHSVFLNAFFPVEPGAAKSFPGAALYWKVFQNYWWFLPAAAIAERRAFRFPSAEAEPPDTSVKAADIAARKVRNAKAAFGAVGMTAPYKNVIRMHLLIFFFAFAHFAKLENFGVYAAVYAVYFFPWRLLGKSETAVTA